MPTVGTVSNLAYGARTNSTISAPTGITVGDGLILDFELADNAGAPVYDSLPSGFALLPGAWPIDVTHTSGFHIKFWRAGKIADAADALAADFSIMHAGATSAGSIMRVINPDPNFVASSVTSLSSGTGQTSTATSVTAATASLLVYSAFDYDGITANTTVPAGMTQLLDAVTLYIATQAVSTGATGTRAQTNGNGSATGVWGASLLAIPGPSGGSGSGASKLLLQGVG